LCRYFISDFVNIFKLLLIILSVSNSQTLVCCYWLWCFYTVEDIQFDWIAYFCPFKETIRANMLLLIPVWLLYHMCELWRSRSTCKFNYSLSPSCTVSPTCGITVPPINGNRYIPLYTRLRVWVITTYGRFYGGSWADI